VPRKAADPAAGAPGTLREVTGRPSPPPMTLPVTAYSFRGEWDNRPLA
jgi:hypothetical protein